MTTRAPSYTSVHDRERARMCTLLVRVRTDFHHTCREVLVETLLLHMDDTDAALQQQVFEALVVLTTRLQIQPVTLGPVSEGWQR